MIDTGKFHNLMCFRKTNYNITPTKSATSTIGQGGKIRKPVRDLSTVDKKNADYADKLSHIKACKSLTPKLIKQLANLEDPSNEIQLLIQIFAEVINAFKKIKYRADYEFFKNAEQLKSYLKTNAITLPNEAGAVKAKIDRLQFDLTNIKRLKKEFDASLRCKVTSANNRGVLILYQFLQSTFSLLISRILENEKSLSKSRERS